MMHPARRSFVVAALFATKLVSQYDPQWQAGDPVPFVSGQAQPMTTWDPDGPGPLPTELVVSFAMDAGDNVTAITSTNGLQLTIGTF